jgi:hypothetical protein
MANKLAGLQNALNQSAGRKPTPLVPVVSTVGGKVAAGDRQANRVGKINIAAWLHPDFKASIRLVQARRGGGIQDIMAEALNDLFAKYDAPQVVDK